MIGGIHMKRQEDILQTIILISFLVIAHFIGNAIIKGILLFLFSTVLIVNTVMKVQTKKDDRLRAKIFYCIMIFFDGLLAASSIYVIAATLINT